MCRGDAIKVYVRVRPPRSYQGLAGNGAETTCLQVTTPTTLSIHCKPDEKTFTFDHVASPDASQESVFTEVGKEIIDNCISGYNGTIFAYGQTGSGKTFTMIGPSDDETDSFSHELRGVIPRSFEYLFSLIAREQQKLGDQVEFLCKCSFLEIYNEQIYDLLDHTSSNLHLRESITRGVYVDGLSEEVVTSAVETYQVLMKGWTNRRVASTTMNRESSRSHAVFKLSIDSKTREVSDGICKIRSSTLNLVDLAGSERQIDTETAGVRLKEAGSINRSLSVLGNVIMALVDIGHGKSRHVHYRDSKLTFLLRDSLGGNAKTTLVANVHPLTRCLGETLSTLNFARRTKLIKNKAVINEDAAGNVLQLQGEIKRLKKLLAGEGPSAITIPVNEDVSELKDMLLTSISLREKAESDKFSLVERIEKLQELCKKKDKSFQSMKMILKLRDSHIASLEKKEGVVNNDDVIKRLREEISQLKTYILHHPDIAKFAAENLSLRAELKRLISKAESTSLERYVFQLEKQLRALGSHGDSPSLDEVTRLTSENTRLKNQLVTKENELNGISHKINLEKEELSVKMATLQRTLDISKKRNEELERMLETAKIKHLIERDNMNESYIKTIRSLTTPSHKHGKSLTSTPLSANKQQKWRFFTPLFTLRKRNSSSENDGEKEEEEEKEEIYDQGESDEDAVMDELKRENSDLIKKLEAQNENIIQLSAGNSSLQSRLSLLERQHQEKIDEIQNELVNSRKLLEESEQVKSILKDEVNDLKVCLKSADKELMEVKEEKKKNEDLMNQQSLKMRELENELEKKHLEYDRCLQDVDNIQIEIDTLKDLIAFKDHQITEKDELISNNETDIDSLKSHIQNLENQLLLEKSSNSDGELRKELSDALNENDSLVKQLEQLNRQLDVIRCELDSALSIISHQNEILSDKTSSIQSLRAVNGDLESKLSVADKELQDYEYQLTNYVTKTTELESQVSYFKTLTEKDANMKAMQSELLAEEVEYLLSQVDYYKNLSEQLDSDVLSKNTQIDTLQRQLLAKETELQLVVSSGNNSELDHMSRDDMEDDLDKSNYAMIIRDLQEQLEIRDKDLNSLQKQCNNYDDLEREHDMLRVQYITLQYKMEGDREEMIKCEEKLREELAQERRKLSDLQQAVMTLMADNETAKRQLTETQMKLSFCEDEIDYQREMVSRIKEQEKEMHGERQALKSQLETIMEEKVKIMKVITIYEM
jgi:kinesin family protein 15